jgi:nicotinamidase-related amidase
MSALHGLLQPEQCLLLLVDLQAGLAFGVESIGRQALINNAVAIARTAAVFQVPVVASTSASKVYSGPLMAPLRAALPGVQSLERHNMNAWEDDAVRSAIAAAKRSRILISGLLTEGCVTMPVLSALESGHEVFVVADACGGLTKEGHDYSLRRMEQAGARLTSWLQVLLEFQRDWTRAATYSGARSIVEDHGGAYGIGLAYARDMIHPQVSIQP